MTVKQGAFGYKRVFNFKDSEGNAVSLDGMDTVKLYVQVGKEVKEFDCVVIDAENGQVEYTVKEGDFDASGTSNMEVEADGPGKCYISENKIKETVLKRVKQE